MLLLLFKKIWDQERVPVDWKEGHIIKLHVPKKGNLSNRENYRSVTHFLVSGKVFSKIMLERIDTQLTSRSEKPGKFQTEQTVHLPDRHGRLHF
jgi:hypothetical protein